MLKTSRNIKTVEDYNEYASEQLEYFVQKLKDIEWATRKPNENEDSEGFDFIWNYRAIELIEKYKRLLNQVGENHFPIFDINIENSRYYQEF